MRLLSLFQSLIKPIFGSFEKEELKKFLRMGATFAFIIGSYWSLRTLKNGIFCTLVGSGQIAYAKTLSLIFLIPLLMIYSRLLDKYGKEKTFYLISATYGTLAIIFAFTLAHTQNVYKCHTIGLSMGWSDLVALIVGYSYYIFVESYGSLIPALFWAIATDTTSPDSAKKGFSLIVAIGQFGGIIAPYLFNSLPRRIGFTTNALSLIVCSVSILATIWLLRWFFAKTPQTLLTSYHGSNEKQEEAEQEPGFFEGFRLLITHKYLLGIFAVVAFPEIIATIFDIHFNSLAEQHFFATYPVNEASTRLNEYLGAYGSSVNIIALTFLLLGIGNISRILGVGVSLLLMPVIYGAAIFGFITLNSLTFLFILMASAKAINYALNGPAVKQLYIPTTRDTRLKAQAWIESFGSRGAKEAGSIINMPLAPMQKTMGAVAGRAKHAILSSYLMFSIVLIWFFIAYYLGKKHKQAINEKRVVC